MKMEFLEAFMTSLGESLYILRKRYNFTHAGLIDNIVYGLNFDDGGVLYLIKPDGLQRITRPEWEALTTLLPPWPWLTDDLLDLS